MNATKIGLSSFLLLLLSGCVLGPLGYAPGECSESCDTQHMECQRGGRPDDQAHDESCAADRERCLDACLEQPSCEGFSCEGREPPTRR